MEDHIRVRPPQRRIVAVVVGDRLDQQDHVRIDPRDLGLQEIAPMLLEMEIGGHDRQPGGAAGGFGPPGRSQQAGGDQKQIHHGERQEGRGQPLAPGLHQQRGRNGLDGQELHREVAGQLQGPGELPEAAGEGGERGKRQGDEGGSEKPRRNPVFSEPRGRGFLCHLGLAIPFARAPPGARAAPGNSGNAAPDSCRERVAPSRPRKRERRAARSRLAPPWAHAIVSPPFNTSPPSR